MSSSDSAPVPAPIPSPLPLEGRLLGIDFGTVRLGFSVCGPEQDYASPLENYTRRSLELDLRHLKQLIQDYRIVGLVVGLPVHMSGEEGGGARAVRDFAAWIGRHCPLPIAFADERYSSSFADDLMAGLELTKKKRTARRDKLAAQMILQGYLDHRDAPPADLRNR